MAVLDRFLWFTSRSTFVCNHTLEGLCTLVPQQSASILQVAYCLCAVCRCVASQLSNQLTQPLGQLRESSAVQRVSSNKSAASDASTAAASSGQLLAGDTGGSQAAGASGAAVVAGQPMTRKLLFEMFMHWCEEGQGRGELFSAQTFTWYPA